MFFSRFARFGALAVLAALPVSGAYAVEGSVMGALTFDNNNYNPTTLFGNPVKGGLGFGGAVLVSGGGLGLDLEAGLMIESETMSVSAVSDTYNFSQTFLDVPLMLVFRPMPFISARAGLYYGFGLGTSVSDTAGLITPGSVTGGVNNDYGAIFGASVNWPIRPRAELRVDLMYQYGIPNLNATSLSVSDSTRLVSIWAGVTYRPEFMGAAEERHRGWGYGGGFAR